MKIAVCCLHKNEEKYLIEWIAHYLTLGANKFYVFDDNSIENENLLKIKNALLESGFVSWHKAEKTNKTANIQMDVYNTALEMAKADGVDWLLCVDLDEFVFLKEHSLFHEMLSSLPDDVSQICLNWRIYGSNDLKFYTPLLVMQRFHRCSYRNFSGNFLVKCFVRVRDVNIMDLHIHDVKGRSINGDYQNIKKIGPHGLDAVYDRVGHVKHYMVKSVEEMVDKMRRGYPDHEWHMKGPIPQKYFFTNDRNEEEGENIFQHLCQVRATINTLI